MGSMPLGWNYRPLVTGTGGDYLAVRSNETALRDYLFILHSSAFWHMKFNSYLIYSN